jgi:hypothetical protein
VSLEVNRRWAAHVETEFRRLGLATPAEAIAIGGETGVILCAGPMSQRPIVRPGSMALMVLVQLPDGAGVDAAWGALTSLPDIDAAIARAGADPAAGQALREEFAREPAEGQEETERARLARAAAELEVAETLSVEDIAALGADGWRFESDGRWVKTWSRFDREAGVFNPETPGGLRALREHAARIRAKATTAVASPDPRWSDALKREDEAPELAERIRAALAIGVRSERDARLVLAALGYSNPDAVERALGETDDELRARLRPTSAEVARMTPAQQRALGGPGEVFATSEAPAPGTPVWAEQSVNTWVLWVGNRWIGQAYAEGEGWAWICYTVPPDVEPAAGTCATVGEAMARVEQLWREEATAAPPELAPGAMRPETRRRIEDAVMATPLPLSHPIGLSCLIMAEGALRNAERATEDAVECAEHILRAIAYLVRRLELDAPAPEEPR